MLEHDIVIVRMYIINGFFPMRQTNLFRDRYDAGQQLAEALQRYANREDVVVLGLPRGGVPVAYEVAMRLRAPLDVFVVRKLGAPGHEEMAIGAIASGGVRVLNRELVSYLDISASQIDAVETKERRELERRENLYRDEYPRPRLESQTIILVDDGLATGATMRAAVQALREAKPASIVVAVPTASRDVCEEFSMMKGVGEVVCLLTPQMFRAVGLWYRDFGQTSDQEVQHLLRAAREEASTQT